jgi:hypothetical protein
MKLQPDFDETGITGSILEVTRRINGGGQLA